MAENSGRLAYDAYARAKGLDSRPWDALPDDDKAGWQLVAEEADRQAAQAGAAELLDTETGSAAPEDDHSEDDHSEDEYDYSDRQEIAELDAEGHE